jgi:3-oxoacyl-(acyl-carrier-protein) synthase
VEPDEELVHGLDIVTERRDSSPKNGAVVSMGFGGQNGGIRLRRWEE